MISTSTRSATVMKTRATVCSSPLRGGFPTPAPAGLCGTVIDVAILRKVVILYFKLTLLLLSKSSENRLIKEKSKFALVGGSRVGLHYDLCTFVRIVLDQIANQIMRCWLCGQRTHTTNKHNNSGC